tara:strand:+ start:8458 stop:8652 length:195 start_codon:yes stop_codon:yes gene_type:complete
MYSPNRDFVLDQLATGRIIRILTGIDAFSLGPTLDARFSYKRKDTVIMLDGMCRQIGYPKIGWS